MRNALFASALIAAVLAAGAADAQNRPGGGDRGGFGGQNPGGQGYGGQGFARGPAITLYEAPNFQGQARSWSAGVSNLDDQGFNDRAQSLRVQGRWRICEDAKLRGRCVEVSGDVPNLAALRMTVAVSSFEFLGGTGGFDNRPGGPGGFGGFGDRPGPGGPGGQGFSGPAMDGRTAVFFPRPEPGPYRNADEFCRSLGLRGVIYADDRGERLRDVLCRR